jgi:hypothetical protein
MSDSIPQDDLNSSKEPIDLLNDSGEAFIASQYRDNSSNKFLKSDDNEMPLASRKLDVSAPTIDCTDLVLRVIGTSEEERSGAQRTLAMRY